MNKGFNGFDGSINLRSGVCLVKFKNTHCTRTPYDKKNRKNFGKSGGTRLHE